MLIRQLLPRICLALGMIGFILGLSIAGNGTIKSVSEEEPIRSVASAPSQVQKATQPATLAWGNLFGPTHDSRAVVGNVPFGEWDANGPPLRWSQTVGEGYSSPVVWGDRVMVLHRIGDYELVDCRSAETGELRWRYRYASDFDGSLAYSDGPYSTPTTDGKLIFTVGAKGQLHALRLEDGSLAWHRDLLTEFDAPTSEFPIGTSPLLEEKLIIVAIGGRQPGTGIVALDSESGRTRWTSTNEPRGYATPVSATIHGQRHVFILTNEAFVSLDPADGRLRWRIPFRPKNPDVLTATTPVVHGDLVFVSAYQVGAMCMRVLPNGGYEAMWNERRSLDSQHNNLICHNGCVIGFSAREHALCCVSMETGNYLWKWKSELDRGTLIALNDLLLVHSETGRLALLSIGPDGPNRKYLSITNPLLPAPCYSSPAISNGRLYLRNETTLACYDLLAAGR